MKLTVFTKENCPYCTLVKYVIGLNPEIELEERLIHKERYAELFDHVAEYTGTHRTFPMVFEILNSDTKKFIGGCTETIEYLKTLGYKISKIGE